MQRGTNISKAVMPDLTKFHAAFVGAGAADATLATNAQFLRGANLGKTCVRTSIGLYVVTLAECTPRVFMVIPEIVGTEGLRATVKVATDTKALTLTINVWDPAGSLDDLETTDTLVLSFEGQNSTA